MSDIKLFRRQGDAIVELSSSAATVEKWLQLLIESQMETFLGVRFLATEYVTGKAHGGRIDSLGIDENNCPVIIEYKRRSDENVINQGLFYLDWLLDHRGEFQLAVQKKFGQETADAIDWIGPRLLCIASDFTKYDEHAVQQIGRTIELIRYRLFGEDLVLLERVNAPAVTTPATTPKPRLIKNGVKPPENDAVVTIPENLAGLFEALRIFVFELGDDIEEKRLKLYVAFKKIKNFACAVPGKTKGVLWLYLKLNPLNAPLQEGFITDVSGKGHWGTGDVEIQLRTEADLEKVKPLIEQSYHNS